MAAQRSAKHLEAVRAITDEARRMADAVDAIAGHGSPPRITARWVTGATLQITNETPMALTIEAMAMAMAMARGGDSRLALRLEGEDEPLIVPVLPRDQCG